MNIVGSAPQFSLLIHYASSRQPVNTRVSYSSSNPCSFARYIMRPAVTKSNQGEDITLEEVGQGDGAMVIPIENQRQEADLVMEEFDGSGDQENVPGAQIVHPWNYDAGHPPQIYSRPSYAFM
ncbi:uncharacterized protein LOC111050390 isoform X2 [Nilaparvata lugens]|uniref:uncharacterized protein LOC111050390 isoform X2 n=1 Tax=Nilaparvata lugens TaxID=108931 RepID=UPI00193D7862|nr:uncharacterized protein LOC111050390 isoform X2 [Nilaparvata lugens]